MTETQVNKVEWYKPNQAEEPFNAVSLTPKWFIDCGPGTGREYAVAHRRWPKCRIVGLEPSEVGFQIARTEFESVGGTLLKKAVWRRNETVFFRNTPNHLQSHIVEKGALNRSITAAHVVGVSLDWLTEEHGITDAFVWADIEGSEEAMIEGARESIEAGKILAMNLEVHDGDRESRIDKLMSGLGFKKLLSYCHAGRHHDNLYVRQ